MDPMDGGIVECVVDCPYCGEALDLTVDASAGSQRYTEDCQVCCRPMIVNVSLDGDGLDVAAWREDDA